MNRSTLPRGLYAITGSDLPGDITVESAVERAIRGGARVIQYREKQADEAVRAAVAGRLAVLCRARGVPLIINDDIALARRCGAAGVHLGGEDSPIEAARAELGQDAIIGASCYNSLARAQAAVAAGADYVAFGRFFPSRSKPQAVQATTELLVEAHRLLDVPLVAIGGITPANGAGLLAAGADLLAAIEGVFGAADIESEARQYAKLFETK